MHLPNGNTIYSDGVYLISQQRRIVLKRDSAIVTCLLKQSYMYDGNLVEIIAPTTRAQRLENGQWKYVLVHTVPFA
jgi:hypothetical protein